jgi:biotin carboxyl carrier protein
MTFEIEINGRVRHVTLERDGQRFRVAFDGHERLVDLAHVDARTYSLIFDGPRVASYEVGLAERLAPDEVEVYLRRGVVYARLDGARRKAARRVAGPELFHGADGVQQIVAPMPGKVVRVLVKAGDEVKARQGLVVVEAMKMENELRAPRDGRVCEVAVEQGMSVEAGRVLMVVE